MGYTYYRQVIACNHREMNMTSGWKRAAIKNMADGFGKDDGGTAKEVAAEINKLHSKIGQRMATTCNGRTTSVVATVCVV